MAAPHVLCVGMGVILFHGVCSTTISHTSDEQLSCAANNSASEVFQCDSVCLPPPSVCNGIPECPDGRDETVQQCGCLDNEFRCANSCVAMVKRCDRLWDCDAGEDERDCKYFICPITHYKCNNHFCIPLHAVCDFIDDCGDRSDEIKCRPRPCWHMEFKCRNGKCIRPVSLCDGTDDCFDGSDEEDCGPDAFVECGDGSRVHRYQWCDDRTDCEDNHADEIMCQKECDESTQFRCSNGRCIRRANVCDSQCDCLPASNSSFYCEDERDCHGVYTIVEGVTLCTLGESLGCSVPEAQAAHTSARERCIRREFLCDGHNDCYNGGFLSDEFGCGDLPNTVSHVTDVFRCRDGRTLPTDLRCDYKHDCLDGDDEDNCDFAECREGEWRCASGQCISLSEHCNVQLNCMDKTDEINCGSVECRQGYAKCEGGGQCLALQYWCDFFLDCPDGSDEINCSSVSCGPDQFACDSGQCVDAAMRCYHSGLPRDGCADGSHLNRCQEWECRAVDQFKCRGGPCVHRSLLCNHHADCKGAWTDEDDCPFTCSDMAPMCECRDVNINCTGRHLVSVPTDTENEITWFYLGSNQLNETLNQDTFVQFERLLFLDLSNNSIRMLPQRMFRHQWRLNVLDLRNNLLTSLTNGSFDGLSSLKALHLRGNKLRVIQAYAFYGLFSLLSLDLRGQRIHKVGLDAFIGLHSLTWLDLSLNEISLLSHGTLHEMPSLLFLDLSLNEISLLSHGTLRGMPSLLFLNLSENQIKKIESNVFRNVPLLDKLVTDEFRFCCLARNTSSQCLPPPDEFSSCEDLMSNLVLRLCVWLLAGVATVGNVLVIVWRTRYSHCNQVHSFLITNLALGDLIMGVYLLLIAVVDWYYRGVYFIHDSAWRSSRLCALAGFLSTFSSELSVFTLTVITLDRFLVIIFPFRVRRLEMARTRRLMALGWLLAAALSALPLSHIPYFHNFYGRSGVCLALHITPDKPSGWEYSVFVFLFLNLVSFSVIAVGYLWMFVAARTTQLAVSRDRRSTESAMAWRMTLLVATDAACWVPIIGLGLASLAGFTMSPQVFAWVAVFVLPLNAAVNPVLYTLSTAPFLSQGQRSLFSSWKSRHNHSSNLTARPYVSGFAGSPKSDNSTCYSLIKRTSVSFRWQQKVDTVVCEHGEVVSLSHLD